MPHTIACYHIHIQHYFKPGQPTKKTELHLVVEGEQPLNATEQAVVFDGSVVDLHLVEEESRGVNLQLKLGAYLYVHVPPTQKGQKRDLIGRLYPTVDWWRW